MKKIIFILIFAFPFTANCQIINIPGDYSSIQEGIDVASDDDTVLVHPGTYYEHLNWSNKTITLASLFLITGDTNYISTTIIDGEASGRVLFIDGAYEEGKLCGFTIQNGWESTESGAGLRLQNSFLQISDMHIKNCYAVRGGGIFAELSVLNLSNVEIADNISSERGGGIMVQNTDVIMENCNLSENTSQMGAAMYYYINGLDSLFYFANMSSCIFADNFAEYQTAGLFMRREGSNNEVNVSMIECEFLNNAAASNGALQIRGDSLSFILENCSFLDNTVSDYTAGAAFLAGCFGEVINCLICSNIANTSGGDWNGGGFTVWGIGTEVSILNSTFADNDAGYGDGITIGPGAIAYATNSIFWNNSDQPFALIDNETTGAEMYIDYCDVQYGIDSVRVDPYSSFTWGEHNVDMDPMFLGSGGPYDPYQLTKASICIDNGTPDTTGMNIPPYDLMGNVRVWDGGSGTAIIDMGAYEFGAPVWVGIDDQEHIPEVIGMNMKVYPNPCRGNANLSFENDEAQRVVTNIFSIRGERVMQMMDETLPSGLIKTNIPLSDLPPGIYLIRISTPDQMNIQKLIVL